MALTTELKSKIEQVAKALGANPKHLEAIIATETGGTFSPSIRNAAGSGAVGLIQFMPKTAQALGTSSAALAQMSAVDQMNYVYKYLLPYKKYLTNFPAFYLAVFYPAAIVQNDAWQFPKKITPQNSGIDLNKNGIITKAEFKTWANKQAAKRGYFFFTGIITLIVLSIAAYLIIE